MASGSLFQLKALSELEVPPYPAVHGVASLLSKFASEVINEGPTSRQEVVELGAYDTICALWTLFCQTGVCGEDGVRDLSPEAEEIRRTTLEALYAITIGFPDIIDSRGFVMVLQALDPRIPIPTQIFALKVIRNICTKSEQNRDVLASYFEIIPPLVAILRQNSPSADYIFRWCSAVKSLILADDKRVAYNRSAERKRILFETQAVRYLSQFLNDFPDESPTRNAIVVVLGAMACREDYCISMEAALPAIAHILSKKHSNTMLAKNTLSLLRFMNVSPIVREKVCAYGLLEHALKVGWLYRNRADVLEISMSCLAFMTLRCPCHVAQFLSTGGVPKIMEMIRDHMDDLPVLKNACFVLRNVAVQGSEAGRKAILDEEGERVIREIEAKYPDIKPSYTKPLLRALKIPVSTTMSPSSASQTFMSLSVESKPAEAQVDWQEVCAEYEDEAQAQNQGTSRKSSAQSDHGSQHST